MTRIIKLGSKESNMTSDCNNAGWFVLQEKCDGEWVTMSEPFETWQEVRQFRKDFLEAK